MKIKIEKGYGVQKRDWSTGRIEERKGEGKKKKKKKRGSAVATRTFGLHYTPEPPVVCIFCIFCTP